MQSIVKKISTGIEAVRSGDKQAVKNAFFIMVTIIVLSLIWMLLSETVLKKEYKRPRATVSASSPAASLSNGFSEVFSSATGLMEVMSIKSSIDSLMQKDNLTEADSIKLIRAFQQLEYLNRQSNKRSNEKN
ncbi:MAG: hypothetical protein M5Z89_05020 [Olivibacter sp.]|nr:hypothetical protein [Olivibacter sp. UJ_SKK_5.1]